MYANILRSAFITVWGNKKLWIIGFFLLFFIAIGEIGYIGHLVSPQKSVSPYSFWQNLERTGIFSIQGLKGFLTLAQKDPFFLFQIMLLFSLGLGIILFLFWISLVSQRALITSVASPETAKKESLGVIYRKASRRFFSLLSINIVEYLLLFPLFLLVSFLSFVRNIILASFLYLIITILFLAIIFFIKYALCGMILKRYGIVESLKNSYFVSFQSWKKSFFMAFTLVGLYIFVALVLAVISVILFVPFFFIMTAAFFLKQMAFVILAFVIYILALAFTILFIRALTMAIFWSAWTYLFLELDKKHGK